MSALVDQQVNTGAPAAGQNGQVNGNSLMQISAGPAALAQKLIYEVMALYSMITQLEGEQKNAFIAAQSEESSAEAHSTKQAGWDAAYGAIAAGALTIAGAGGSMAVGFGFGAGKKEETELNGQMAKLDAEQKPMKSLQALDDDTVLPVGEEIANDGESIQARMDELKAGKYPQLGSDGEHAQETKDAVAQLKKDPKAYEEYTKKRDARIEEVSKEINTKMTRVSNMYQRWNTMSNTVSQMANAGSTTAQGVGQGFQATESANASLTHTAGSLAGQEVGADGQAQSQAGASQNKEVDVLEAMVRSGSVQA